MSDNDERRPEDLEPTAYESAMARKTGATVEQLRHEQEQEQPLVRLIAYKGSRSQHERLFRPFTLEQARQLKSGLRVWFKSNDGGARMAKVNGKPRTWKRDPARIEVPLKYGLYEYFTLTATEIADGQLLMEAVEQ